MCLSVVPDRGGLRLVLVLANDESMRVVGFLSIVELALKSKSTIDLDLVVLARMSW